MEMLLALVTLVLSAFVALPVVALFRATRASRRGRAPRIVA